MIHPVISHGRIFLPKDVAHNDDGDVCLNKYIVRISYSLIGSYHFNRIIQGVFETINKEFC